jgi:hypothetical protein
MGVGPRGMEPENGPRQANGGPSARRSFIFLFSIFHFPFPNQFKCSFELQIYVECTVQKKPSMNIICLINLFIILFNQMISNIKFIHTNIENGYFKKYNL